MSLSQPKRKIILSEQKYAVSKVRGATGVYHSAYLRRVLGHLTAACQDVSSNLRVLYTQRQFFQDANLYVDRGGQRPDRIVLTPTASTNSFRVILGQRELEWPLK